MKKNTFMDVVWRILMFLWGLSILFPLVWIFYESLKTNREFFQSAWSLPAVPQWKNYKTAWNNLNISRAMLNTVYYVGASGIIGLFITTICAYALTRLEWKGKKLVYETIMISLFLPGINALVPQYVLAKKLHLVNSLTGLITLNVLAVSAFDILLLGGFMQTIPNELEESAYIDGASIFQVYWKVVMPLAKPGIMTVGIFKFLGLYNDFLPPLIYLSDPKKYTIGVNMYQANQLMQYKADWVSLCAGVVLAMIPTLVVYLIFQKQIVEGATLGSVKG
jgi:ABC-type glycerol-3-phosphate transport system permease component